MIQTEVIGLEAFGRQLGVKVSALTTSLRRALREVKTDLVAKVKADKLSGQVLNVRTGRLRRSITGRVVEEDGVLTAEVGTNVDYGLIHEFGGMRAAEEAMKAGRAAFSAQFTPRELLPKRAFLRPTLYENKAAIDKRIAGAVAEAIRA